MKIRHALLIAATGTVLLEAPAFGACLSDVEVAAMVAAYTARSARTAAANPEGLSAADGECSRATLLQLLEARHGKPLGYRAGLTNPAVQKRFNHDTPVWGALYAPMLLADGAVVDAAFGARPLFEADLLARISDDAVNRDKTPEDVLQAIDQGIPFIELPDLVVVVRGDGAELDRGKGSDVLGHPLAAVAWLAQDMAREGRAPKKGDLVSLGSFSKLMPPKPGLAVEAAYEGLPGAPKVKVTFK